MGNALHEGKTFDVSKREIYEAYEAVSSNGGACGIDGCSLADFQRDLRGNLYRIWNRMASGSYFPPAVRRVDIPKGCGKTRPLGIPTVADRIAQMVIKRRLEPVLEPLFHAHSYGYRPGRSALEAIGHAREHCWRHHWVVDLDIQGFFDAIPHDLLLKAVDRHCTCRWQRLYIRRWLTAPVQYADGSEEPRYSGTPQGGVISPLLANLFLHYAFDAWMDRRHSGVRFERYADDVICHCRSERHARYLLDCVRDRMASCGLLLHPEKSKVVCCDPSLPRPKPGVRETYARSFDFLGYRFAPRTVRTKQGDLIRSFSPALSLGNERRIRQQIREVFSKRHVCQELHHLAAVINPRLRGWLHYYSRYSWWIAQRRIGHFLDRRIINWAMKKYRRFHQAPDRAWRWLLRLKKRSSELFAHWLRPACKM